jgi:predicted ATP-grasp superfamily ATP-dependent carboligase
LEELKEKYPPIYSQFGNCTLQELIANREYYYNVMIYRDAKGDILASTIIKIVRMYPVNAGSSTCCITVDNPALISLCIKALEAMNWVGMADFDVLQRLDNEEYKIIEINPRVPASLRAAYISGVNFPEIIAREAVGLSPKEYHYEPGKILRYLGTDLLWAIKKRKLWGNHPSWWTFISKSTFYQDIYIQDSSTWFTWFISGISKLWNRNKRLR